VLVDALRYDYLGFNGYSEPVSPFLDELAAQSVVFDRAYSHCSQTLNSTATMLAGVYSPPFMRIPPDAWEGHEVASTLKEGAHLNVLVPSQPTFVETLASSGYVTVGILTNPHHREYSGFPVLFTDPIVLFQGWRPTDEEPYIDGRTVNDAFKNWLVTRADDERPYMAYVHYMDVHWPYQAPEEWTSKFVNVSGNDQYLAVVYKDQKDVNTNDLLFMRQSYNAEIAYVDSLLRELFAAAAEHSTRPTVFIVTSDHGEEFMDHGGLGHGRTLELELIRVPLLIHGVPGEPPARRPEVTRHIDIGPTILALAEIEDPDRVWPGRNLLPSFDARESGQQPENETVFSVARYSRFFSATTQDWHFILDDRDGSAKLYGMHDDPRGLHDVADDHPEVVRELSAALGPFIEGHRASVAYGKEVQRVTLAEGGIRPPSEETLLQLKSLGYIQ
jgi:arylsulfatase